MRALGRGILILFGLVVVALVAVYLNLAHLIKSEVQKEGTRSMRLETTLDSARIEIFDGKVGLHGLGIASPHGFSAPKMLQIGDAAFQVSWRELRKNPVHIDALKIDKPTLIVEQSGGALNFRKAMELMPASDPKKPLRLIIDRIEIEDALVVIRPGLPGVQEEIAVPVPALTIKDVGRGKGAKNGAAVKDVAMQVMTALAGKAAESDQLPVQVKGLLHLNASSAAKTLEGLLPAGRSPRK